MSHDGCTNCLPSTGHASVLECDCNLVIRHPGEGHPQRLVLAFHNVKQRGSHAFIIGQSGVYCMTQEGLMCDTPERKKLFDSLRLTMIHHATESAMCRKYPCWK